MAQMQEQVAGAVLARQLRRVCRAAETAAHLCHLRYLRPWVVRHDPRR